MGDFSWWNVVPSTVGGLIGGGFALLAGALAGRRERSKAREAHEREGLLSARLVLLRLEELYIKYRSGEKPGELTEEGEQSQHALLRDLETLAASLRTTHVREVLEFAARAMGHSGITTFQGHHNWLVTRNVCSYAIDVISAELRSSQSPTTPAFVEVYRSAMDEADEIAMQQYEQWEAEQRRGQSDRS
ncbi:hypothetical protein ACGFI9_16930 [Micromonospora sp. NPDC048930]|uniref:hypothetical protein n=1 Tax=Micromonospora sp. NPDC048930 TaxID=3364261 RepID=UPI00371C1269